MINEDHQIETLKHLEHLESLIYMAGSRGNKFVQGTIASFTRIFNKFKVLEKIDGAPSLTCGYIDGEFFVSTKSLFAKTPKYSRTEEEIEQNHGHAPGLAAKLKEALQYLPPVIPDNGMIWQGDFMFGDGDKRIHKFDDGVHIIFRPNTITYAVPVDSPIGKEVEAAKIGIIFHTSYTGGLENLSINLKPDVSVLKRSRDVWLFDNALPSTAALEFTGEELNLYKNTVSQLQAIESLSDQIGGNKDLVLQLNTFYNSKVRTGDDLENTGEDFDLFVGFVKGRAAKEAEKVSMEKSKQAKLAKGQELVDWLEQNKTKMQLLFNAYGLVIGAKESLINKLDKVAQLKQFYETDDGFEVANPEGFVAVADDGVIKLVHRLEFSRANLLNTKFG